MFNSTGEEGTLQGLRGINYKDILKMWESFVSLDISITGTGYVKWENGELTQGVYEIKSKEIQERKREYRDFLLWLFEDKEYEIVFVEDTIMGKNYKTTKGLIMVNSVLDDMMDYNILKRSPIVRKDNVVWKKGLRDLSALKLDTKCMNDKEEVRARVNDMGYYLEELQSNLTQNMYDAMGMALGLTYRIKMQKEEVVKSSSRGMNLKTAKFKAFGNLTDALTYATKLSVKSTFAVVKLQDAQIPKDLVAYFAEITKVMDTRKIFVIECNSKKLGVLAFKEGIDLNLETQYLVLKGK